MRHDCYSDNCVFDNLNLAQFFKLRTLIWKEGKRIVEDRVNKWRTFLLLLSENVRHWG